jgi:hypothetical protein
VMQVVVGKNLNENLVVDNGPRSKSEILTAGTGKAVFIIWGLRCLLFYII